MPMIGRRFSQFLLATAILLRGALILLPALGRDEVTYLWWTWHPRLDYAPLLQLQIGLFRLVSTAPWFLRLSQFMIGGVVLWLFFRWLRERGTSDADCWLGVAALAACPWQVFSGAILHPDGLFLLGLLLFARGLHRERAGWVGIGALVCLGAKLTGLVVVAMAIAWLLRHRRWAVAGPVAAILAIFLFSLDAGTVEATRQFARVGGGPGTRAAILLLESLLIGLPFVLGALRRPEFDWARATAFLLLGGFLLALLSTGQCKANWILPEFVLLWPQHPGRWVRTATLVALGLSGAMVTGFLHPRAAASAEASLSRRGLLPRYELLAGQREARVASAESWPDYLGAFRSDPEFANALPPETFGEILTDDYAIGARIALTRPIPVPFVVVPDDPLFAREPEGATERLLVVAARTPLELLLQGRVVETTGTLPHPVTGEPLPFAIVQQDRHP